MSQNDHTDFKVAVTNLLNKVKVNTFEIMEKQEILADKLKLQKQLKY